MADFKCEVPIGAGLCKADCCGFVPLNKKICKEYEHRKQVKPIEILEFSDEEIIPITEDGKCIFLDREKCRCTIYEERPVVCRKYGVHDDLLCPYIKPNGNVRSLANSKRVLRQNNNKIDCLMKQLNAKVKYEEFMMKRMIRK